MDANENNLYSIFPAALRVRKQWLLWRYEGQPNAKGKLPKIPYYANGQRRSGTQGSDEDRAALVTFDKASKAMQASQCQGLGFAFLPNDQLTGIDIDHCFDPETGELSELANQVLALVPDGYTEISPSRTGLHIIARCDRGETFKDNGKGLEVFSGRQFFTMSGQVFGDLKKGPLGTVSPEVLQKLKRMVKGEPGKPASSPVVSGIGSQYGMAALRDACQKIANAAEGTRNDTLNNQALSIARLVAGGQVSESVAKAALEDAGQQCGLALPEVRATLNSAFRAGLEQPRNAPAGQQVVPVFQQARSSSAAEIEKRGTIKGGVTGVTGVTTSNGAGFRVTPAEGDGVTGVTNTKNGNFSEPEEDERPCFRVLDGWQQTESGRKLKPGLWLFGIKHGREGAPPQLNRQWVCSPLHVDAVTCDMQESNFGRLLRFSNTFGRWRQWAMPMELLRGSGEDMRGMLLGMGVMIDPHGRGLLSQYLAGTIPERRVLCALQTGWHNKSFVLPDSVIGPDGADMIFQSAGQHDSEYTTGGTLAGWQQGIASQAAGNPLLMLSLSAAFAGPLLTPCNMEGGGIHFIGSSSTGKTTALQAAVSVWGGPDYRRSWRATANGMEGAASLFNDSLLALDEISECEPKEVGAIVYTLGNGTGKQRASRTGTARNVTRWRCIVLSSGERSIETTMEDGGYRIKAGQSVRLLNIPASRKYGAWDTLHDAATGTAFSDALKRESAAHYGHAGRAFLERLTHDGRDLCALLEQIRARPEFNLPDAEGQEMRAAGRFALLALAGELATEYGITGWQQGDAVKAAIESFRTWRNSREGRGNSEVHQVVQRVMDFLDRHGDSRFSNAACPSDIPVRDRAGWWRDEPGGRMYLFNPGASQKTEKIVR